ncbi:MAG: type II secretion system protein J [Acidobacteriota bacterium]
MYSGENILSKFNSNSGITLVELLVVLLIFGVVLGGIYQFFDFGQRTIDETETLNIMQQKVSLFTTEIRREATGAVNAADGLDPIVVSPSGKDVDIYTDIDWDNIPELVQYRWHGGTLQRRVVESTTTTKPYKFESDPDWKTVFDHPRKLKDPHPDWFFEVKTADNGKNGKLLSVEMEVDDPVRPLRNPLQIKMKVITRGINTVY